MQSDHLVRLIRPGNFASSGQFISSWADYDSLDTSHLVTSPHLLTMAELVRARSRATHADDLMNIARRERDFVNGIEHEVRLALGEHLRLRDSLSEVLDLFAKYNFSPSTRVSMIDAGGLYMRTPADYQKFEICTWYRCTRSRYMTPVTAALSMFLHTSSLFETSYTGALAYCAYVDRYRHHTDDVPLLASILDEVYRLEEGFLAPTVGPLAEVVEAEPANG